MKNPIFSVIVATYNSDFIKTKRTLYSILIQKYIDFELIVVDDGSRNNNFEQIREYLLSEKFGNYTLIANEKNQGIVKNVLSGLKIAKGDFVKLISPGDFLYSEEVLCNVYKYTKNNKASIYFTNNYYYYLNENGNPVINEERKNPLDLTPYLNNNLKQIKKNYLCKHDYILGAGVFEKTSDLLESLLILEPHIKYAEDTSIIYMIASGAKISYIDTGGVWYEDNCGISTKENSFFQDALYRDNKSVFRVLMKEKKIDILTYYMSYSNMLFIRRLCHLLKDPIYILKKFKKENSENSNGGWKKDNFDIILLNRILECKEN